MHLQLRSYASNQLKPLPSFKPLLHLCLLTWQAYIITDVYGASSVRLPP